jgi:5'-3' exonuclease
MIKHLLIDGKNLLYRALYASYNGTTDQFVVISRCIHGYYDLFPAQNIHVFWDAKPLWRDKIYPEYKKGRVPHNARIDADIAKYQPIAMEIWSKMNTRQYRRDKMEADDLIYAFCHHFKQDKIIIASSDGDMTQISFYHDNVQVYNPLEKKIVDRPTINPVDIKCLDGDKSDNIIGYTNIGEVKSRLIAEDYTKLSKLLAESADKYKFNRSLIDLAMCPYLLTNVLYILSVMKDKPVFEKETIRQLCEKYKIRGMVGEFSKVILPFGRTSSNIS